MAAFGTKVVVLMMVLPSLVLLLQTSSVEAVDLLAWNNNGCTGPENGGCYAAEAGLCCVYNSAGGVKIQNLLTSETGILYTGGGCTTEVARFDGPSNDVCYFEYAFSGAKWEYKT